MHIIGYVLLLLTNTMIIISGGPKNRSSFSKIETDAAQLSRLAKKFWAFSSETLMSDTKLKCKALSKCCSQKDYSKKLAPLATGFKIDPFSAMFFACLGSFEPNHVKKTCPLANNLNFTLLLEPDNDTEIANPSHPFIQNMNKYEQVITGFFEEIPQVCKSEEVHAIVCISNENLSKNCVNRILKKQMKLNGKKKYAKVINQYKNAFQIANQMVEMMKAIIKSEP